MTYLIREKISFCLLPVSLEFEALSPNPSISLSSGSDKHAILSEAEEKLSQTISVSLDTKDSIEPRVSISNAHHYVMIWICV